MPCRNAEEILNGVYKTMNLRNVIIDKTARIEELLKEHLAVCLSGMPGTGRKTAVRLLLKKHPDLHILSVRRPEGFAPGRPEWAELEERNEQDGEKATLPSEGFRYAEGLQHTMRLWPHKLKGEGHFVAVLEKEGSAGQEASGQEIAGQEGAGQATAEQKGTEQETAGQKTAGKEEAVGKRTRRRDGEKGLSGKVTVDVVPGRIRMLVPRHRDV